MNTRFVPPSWPRVVPRLVARDAEGLVDFVKAAFEATGEYRGNAPCELRIGDSLIMISDAGERAVTTGFLYVYVPDTDDTHRRALALGARSLEEPSEMPYGDRRGMVEDPWGNVWQIATHRAFGPS